MSVRFGIAARRDPRNVEAPPRYYPQVKSRGTVGLRQLSERIADISTVSSVDTLAVLEALLVVVPQELAQGNVVQLGDFGSFSLRTQSRGSDTPDEVTAQNIIRRLVTFRPGKRFKQVLDAIIFEKDA